MKCPKCKFENPVIARFCSMCGEKLGEALFDGERKQVTVLFSDLSGYTSISERLDPEEVNEIINRIFSEATRIVSKYDGHIEKFIGDAVMVLFGFPQAHEDDAVRAIKSVQELHTIIKSLSPEYESRIGRDIAMHSGISTGLIVTYDLKTEEEKNRLLGDSINLASRLSGLAKAGEIVVSEPTFRQSEQFFSFERMEPVVIKGKEKPVHAYKVITAKEKPVTIHRLSGLRSGLVGRRKETSLLRNALYTLQDKHEGSITAICGEAGIGKSRLVEEFRANLDIQQIQWVEGHAYAYAQDMPYYPLTDLLNRVWNINEYETREEVRTKIESNLEVLGCKKSDIAPYLGSLYGLKYAETEIIEPEMWKYRLFGAVKETVTALASQKPTVMFLEDLQWADPSSIELFRFLMKGLRSCTLFVITYRSAFRLFSDQELKDLDVSYREIRLRDLSALETEEMIKAILKSSDISLELKKCIYEKTEGNPFYLEEVINSLVETNTLVAEDGGWKETGSMLQAEIPSTIEGVISARLDKLEIEKRHLLQQASAIGKVFQYRLLENVILKKERLDDILNGLERLDLIRISALEPEREFTFKHALIQEVAYNRLLKIDRQKIHERIAGIIEEQYRDRLPDFYETLAYHYKQAGSVYKAIDFLMKSGEKTLSRYAIEESNKHYLAAYSLLMKENITESERNNLLLVLLIKWCLIFYFRADFRGMLSLLKTHESDVKGINDQASLSMFYFWLSMALFFKQECKDAFQSSNRSLLFGEESREPIVIGYACVCQAFSNLDLGLLDEAVVFGERARRISESYLNGQQKFIYQMALGWLGYSYWARGETERSLKHGSELLEYALRHNDVLAEVHGHYLLGYAYYNKGDLASAAQCFQKGADLPLAPWYSLISKFFLGITLIKAGKFGEAEKPLQEISEFSTRFGIENFGRAADMLLGVVLVSKGMLAAGMKKITEASENWYKNGNRFNYAVTEYLISRIYIEILEKNLLVRRFSGQISVLF
jgi:class 3 adenylate cyclase